LNGAAWLAILVVTLFIALSGLPVLNRDRAAMLIAAGLILAPYSVGNSVLTVLAIGIISLFLLNWRLGLPLLVLTNLPFVFPRQIAYDWGALYWLLFLLLNWGIFCYRSRVNKVQISSVKQLKPA
jgi:hypothetical protein